MTTLRESLQAEIATVEADLAAKRAKLAEIETGFVGVIDRDIEEVKSFIRSVGAHLFPHAPVVASQAAGAQVPAAPVAA